MIELRGYAWEIGLEVFFTSWACWLVGLIKAAIIVVWDLDALLVAENVNCITIFCMQKHQECQIIYNHVDLHMLDFWQLTHSNNY